MESPHRSRLLAETVAHRKPTWDWVSWQELQPWGSCWSSCEEATAREFTLERLVKGCTPQEVTHMEQEKKERQG